MSRRGLCLVLAAPSGAGKTTLSRRLLAANPALALSISATTRAPRAGEQEGEHYFFKTNEQFAAMVTAGAFLEHATVFERSYGTPRAPVEARLRAGQDVLFDIDWQGFRQVRAALPGDVVGVFIRPPSLAALRARLLGRGDAPEDVARRMAAAQSEWAHQSEFDYIVRNDDLDQALNDLQAILRASRLATARQAGFAMEDEGGDSA
ncbi:MAG TPA: guanylate kinase [Acidiphilium sp.]|nr:MAG: guanylate kinase [Acidiphilium sp. 21-60-14]OYV91640.1 MAG: guanylate kinase [Acidiphilium sp. 37-60-79]HQT87692.1 guanylate kinase [Acidiphilium sp.]HQU22819.1 guanylate kinase [Acidiphilium sp.]